MEIEAAAAAWRRDGFVVLPGLLAGAELDAARADLPAVCPTAQAFHADPEAPAHRHLLGDEFAGIVPFPFPSLALCNLVVHERVVAFAEAAFATTDLRTYAAELWAKYTGAAPYAQEHHRDYLNHTPLVPTSDARWRGLELFIWLHDVPEELGPTHVVPIGVTSGLPALPHGYLEDERPELYEAEVSGAGVAGTVLAYSTDTFHRGTDLTAPGGARFSAHVSYRCAEGAWIDRHAWGDRSFDPAWRPFVEQATLRQLLLFGFPPPGHPYWSEESLAGMGVRYPGLDLDPWRVGTGDPALG